jgi:GAF domain-containing protein
VFQAGQPILFATPEAVQAATASRRAETDHLFVAALGRSHSVVSAPLLLRNQTIGVITFGQRQPEDRAFTPADLDLLVMFANQAALAIHNAQLHERIERRNADLAALLEVSHSLVGSLDVDEVCHNVLQSAIRVIPNASNGIVWLWDELEGALVPQVATGYRWEALAGVRYRSGEGASGKTFQSGRPLLLATTEEVAAATANRSTDSQQLFAAALDGAPHSQSNISAPLLVEGKPIGVITFGIWSADARPFTPADLDLLVAFANQAAMEPVP